MRQISMVLPSGDVKEEGECVLLLLPALIALEGILVPVVIHVEPVHQFVLERDPAKFTRGPELRGPCRNRHKARHCVRTA